MNIFAPIQWFADFVTEKVFGAQVGSSLLPDQRLPEAFNFFVNDIIKIFILLFVIIFVVSVIRTFLPAAKVRRVLSGRRAGVGNLLAAVFGIFTPFCTCSAIPLFLGFVEAGVPLGVTFSFLVASPMINEIALVLLLGLFGWKVALLYIGSGLVISVLAGVIIGKLSPEKLLKEDVLDGAGKAGGEIFVGFSARALYARKYTFKIVKKVFPFVLLGVGLGAFMHGYIPSDFLATYASADKWYAVPLAVLVGIPLYANAAGVLPLVSVLTEKGVAIGTTLAFMMAVTGLSLPEFMILRRVMKVRLILMFAAVVGVGIIATGYLFNLVI